MQHYFRQISNFQQLIEIAMQRRSSVDRKDCGPDPSLFLPSTTQHHRHNLYKHGLTMFIGTTKKATKIKSFILLFDECIDS